MLLFHLIVVAAIQGITEFLPVSSSGHLVLLPLLTSWEDQGLVIDVCAHVGSLLAVIVYFRREVLMALTGLSGLLRGRWHSPQSRLALCLIIATLPVIMCGLAIYLADLNELFRNLTVIGSTTLIFGVVLFLCDRFGRLDQPIDSWSSKDALILGLLQALSLIPGTSRSGIVISGARLIGYNRSDAARISMLMSIPTILAAGTLSMISLLRNPESAMLEAGLIVVAVSFLAALGTLAAMMKLLDTYSFTPYVIYRVILGLILLTIAFS